LSDVLVLCYHGISERWPADLATRPRDLEQHVALLAKRGYRGVTFHEAVVSPPPGRAVAITFDDAYRSVIESGLPILSAAGFTGTVFTPTAFVGSDRPMAWAGIEVWLDGEHADELIPMSWEELDRLAQAGWEIGSHTRSHPHLTDLDAAGLDEELAGSKRDIERRLEGPCRSLAYPYGDHDRGVAEAARRAGYDAAATLPQRLRPARGSLDWPRIVVVRADDVRRFRWKVSPRVRRVRTTPAWTALSALRRLTAPISQPASSRDRSSGPDRRSPGRSPR
jgi:peptidoglycan/xylan/chitin deacetylase (PgdA/CDA1 family)